jgi:hypothetical protein
MRTTGVVDFPIFYVSYLIPSDNNKHSKTPNYIAVFTIFWDEQLLWITPWIEVDIYMGIQTRH